MRTESVVELFKSLEIYIENGYVCAHADCDLTCVHADRTAAEDNNVCLGRTGNACEENAFAAELLFEILGAFLNGKTACDL